MNKENLEFSKTFRNICAIFGHIICKKKHKIGGKWNFGVLDHRHKNLKWQTLKIIVSWNTGGLRDITGRHIKVEPIRNILEKANKKHGYGHAPSNDNFSGIAIIVNKISTILSHEVMIEGRLTHTKLQRLHNSKIYNIFCYYGYIGQKKIYENNIKHVDLDRNKMQNEKLENLYFLGDFNWILDKNS